MKEIVDRDSRSEVYLDFVIYVITKRFAVRGLNTTKLYWFLSILDNESTSQNRSAFRNARKTRVFLLRSARW